MMASLIVSFTGFIIKKLITEVATRKPTHQIMTVASVKLSSVPNSVSSKADEKPDISALDDEKALQRHRAAIKRCVDAGNYPAMGYGFSTICVKHDFVDRSLSDPGPY